MKIKEIKFHWTEDFPIFACERYLKSVATEYGWMAGFINDQMNFVLPFSIRKKGPFRYIVFEFSTLVFTNDLNSQLEKSFLNGVVHFFQINGFHFIAQPPTHVVFNAYPDNSIFAPFGSYHLDLTQDYDTLWVNLNQKHRNVIRNAERAEVIIKKGSCLKEIAYDLINCTLKRSKKKFLQKDNFFAIINNLAENMELFVSYKDSGPQGCAVVAFSEFGAYYLWGGSIESPHLGSLNLLHWKIIEHFKSKRIKLYDFAGARLTLPQNSKLAGIQRFKRGFGGQLHQGYLWKYPIHNLKYCLYNLLYRIRVDIHGDIIDQERTKLNE
jgi:hypothetical protein